MKRIIFCLFFASLGLISLFAFEVTVTGPDAEVSTEIKNEVEDFTNRINNEELNAFNTWLANTTATASRGIGWDYANTGFKYFTLGVSVSAGVSPAQNIKKLKALFSETNENDNEINLLAPSVLSGVYLGLDMHYVPVPILKDFKFYTNFFYMDYAKLLNKSLSERAVDKAAVTSFGIHFVYPVVKPVTLVSKHLFYWGGVLVSGGLDYVANDIRVNMQKELTNNGNSDRFFIKARMDSKIFTLPIEVSTNIRLIHVLSLFAGLGTDFNFGKAYLDISGTIQDNGDTYDVTIDLGKKGRPHFMSVRAFTGCEINIAVFHILAKAEYSIASKTLAAQVGTSISY